MPFWDTVRNPESLFDAVWFWYLVPFWFYWYFLQAFWFYHFLPFSNEILCKSVKKLTVAYALFDLTLNWVIPISVCYFWPVNCQPAGGAGSTDRHGLGHGRARVSWFSASIHLCSKELHNVNISFLNSHSNFCNP